MRVPFKILGSGEEVGELRELLRELGDGDNFETLTVPLLVFDAISPTITSCSSTPVS
jgi:hypothetical protein